MLEHKSKFKPATGDKLVHEQTLCKRHLEINVVSEMQCIILYWYIYCSIYKKFLNKLYNVALHV